MGAPPSTCGAIHCKSTLCRLLPTVTPVGAWGADTALVSTPPKVDAMYGAHAVLLSANLATVAAGAASVPSSAGGAP